MKLASPEYLDGKALPTTPHELTGHHCVNLRLPSHGGLYAWNFEKEGESVKVRAEGQAVFNNTLLMVQAALDGMGFAYVPFDIVGPYITNGKLIPVLEDWWPSFPGYHLYYANHRQIAPALALVIDALRYRERPSAIARPA